MHEAYVFAATGDKALADSKQVAVPGIAVYRSFDEEKVVFRLEGNVDAISALLTAAATPLVVELYPETYRDYVDVSLDAHSHVCVPC